MRSFALVAVSLAALLSVRSAWADHTFACQRPPDREARVAVRDNVAVGWTQDQNSRTCTFSVDGAKAASPPANLILKGFNSLRNGAPVVNELRQKQVDNLAYAMLATAPVSDIPTEFRSALSQNANTLARCLANFFSEGRPPALEPTEGAAVTCRVAPQRPSSRATRRTTWKSP
jgi:hypothetical protein